MLTLYPCMELTPHMSVASSPSTTVMLWGGCMNFGADPVCGEELSIPLLTLSLFASLFTGRIRPFATLLFCDTICPSDCKST